MSRLTILMYHMVCEPGSQKEARYAITPAKFLRHMRFLAQSEYTVLSFAGIEGFIRDQEPFPERSVAITFDDGFANNYEHAYPILGEYDLPATIFLVSARMNGVNEWMSGQNEYPERPILNWQQVHEMANSGIGFGSHTVSHANLLEVNEKQMFAELSDSKKALEDNLGRPVSHFAYPFGAYNQVCRDMVGEAGYTLACTTRPGFNNQSMDTLELRRLEVYGTDSVSQLKQKIKFGTNDSSWRLRPRYYSRRLAAKFKGN